MTDVLDDLRRAKADAMAGGDAGMQQLFTRAIDEIESLRSQFLDGVTGLIGKLKETNVVHDDIKQRLDRAGL
jgi:hypothetical protein